MTQTRNILILCTGNSARSILAEAIINRKAGGRFTAYSAGSQPKGAVHPGALRLLQRRGYRTDDLRSKSWDEFAGEGAPSMDFVITVCGNAANETCPVCPGGPFKAHWGVDDPAAVEGDEETVDEAFEEAHDRLARRINAFLALDLDAMSEAEIRASIAAIGKMG